MAGVSDASSSGAGDGEGRGGRERGREEEEEKEKEEEERSEESHQRPEAAAAWGRDIWCGGATKQTGEGHKKAERPSSLALLVSSYQPDLDLNNQFNPQNLNLKDHFKYFFCSHDH